LSAVAAGSPSNVWIAGRYFDTVKDASERFIALQWQDLVPR